MDRKKLVRARKAANEPGGLVQKTVAKTVGKIPFTKNRTEKNEPGSWALGLRE
jgi:hypothetical protein